jgi:hypothetical protein
MLLALTLPAWLMDAKFLPAATWGLVFVTLLLVLATFFLYFDSRGKGKEQRSRWDREDASRVAEQRSRWEREDRLRAADAKPRAVVEIAKRDTAAEIVFLCFNLGSAIFFIDEMIVTVTGGFVQTSKPVGPPVLLPGTFVSIPLDCKPFVKDGSQEANVVFVLKGSHSSTLTEPAWFYFFPDEIVGYDWRVGRLSDRKPGVIVRQPRSIAEV